MEHLIGQLLFWWSVGVGVGVGVRSEGYLPPAPPARPQLEFIYHSHQQLQQYLADTAKAFPTMTRLYTIGRSVNRKNLTVLEISAAPKDELGIPNVKLIGNMHGNEPVGREIILHFIEFLLTMYPRDSSVQWFLDTTRIHLLPTLNPDGFDKSARSNCIDLINGRTNLRGVDLNRNFPDHFQPNTMPVQSETTAVMSWMQNTPFVLSASLHSGSLVANYPFENNHAFTWEAALKLLKDSEQGQDNSDIWKRVANAIQGPKIPSLSPDDDVFRHLALVYSRTHPTMHQGLPCPLTNERFENGITNGAAWYPVRGGMQDYNYVWHGCMELTLEISCCKYPAPEELPKLWQENKEALFKYFSQVHYGVKGFVLDGVTNKPIPKASLWVDDRNYTFNSSDRGEFWRILLPGNYTLKVKVPGYQEGHFPFEVKSFDNNSLPQATWLNASMFPPSLVSQQTSSTTSTKVHTSLHSAIVIEEATTEIHTTRNNLHVELFNSFSNMNDSEEDDNTVEASSFTKISHDGTSGGASTFITRIHNRMWYSSVTLLVLVHELLL